MADPQVQPEGRPLLVEITEQGGLRFTHWSGATGALHIVETVAPGIGVLDADRDGDLDLWLCQGAPQQAQQTAPAEVRLGDRMWRNEATAGAVRFSDASTAVGLGAAPSYSMGVAVGDVDGDGWADVYVTAWGPNRLWMNRGGTSSRLPRRPASTTPG